MNYDVVGYNIGYYLATAVMVIGPVALGYWVSKSLTAKREGYEPVRWPIAVGCAVSALMLLGQCTARHAEVSARAETNSYA